jgi:hypothetical protein
MEDPAMPTRRIPRICYDRFLEGEDLVRARDLAMSERLDNPPLLRMSAAPTGGGAAPMTDAGPMRTVAPAPSRLALETRTLWKPGRVLRVRFMDGDAAVRAKVKAVAKTWEQHANLCLEFGNDPEAEIRISFFADAGSWSWLGTDCLAIPKDRPTMNYGWLRLSTPDIEYQRVVLHEFGHALGCIHEHQHPTHSIPWNRDAVIRAYSGPPNHWSLAQIEANVLNKYNTTITQFSAFDPRSIMLYPVPRELTDGVFEVGMNTGLSETDKAFMAKMYPNQGLGPQELLLGGAPLPAEIKEAGEEDQFYFVVQQAGTYTVETLGRTDVSMGLFGPDDRLRQIAQDDDSGQGLNAKISTILIPGQYFVRVRHFRPRGVGQYTVSVRKG